MGMRGASRRSSSAIDCVPRSNTVSKLRVRVELRAWAAAFLTLGASLCFVPLFDVLGYEFCLALALAASFAGAHLGAVAPWYDRRERAASAVTAAAARPGATVARLWAGTTARLWAALGAPLAAIAVNGLRVRNCAWAAGLAWFVMLP